MWGWVTNRRRTRLIAIGLPGVELVDPRDLLPGRPWIGGRPDAVAAGAVWVVCVDLLAEEVSNSRRVTLRAPVATFQSDGRAICPDDVLRLPRHWWGGLLVIPAGTEVRVVRVSETRDYMFDSEGGGIDFALHDGRTFKMATWESSIGGTVCSLSWPQVACLAAIVPADHPLASDRAAAEALVARIGRMANGDPDGVALRADPATP